jgi:hypothetical protein
LINDSSTPPGSLRGFPTDKEKDDVKVNESNECLNAALELLDKGCSVIPVNPTNKKPYIQWSEFQKRHPTEDEILEWWQKWPNANVAIVTGRISKLLVIDCDGPKGVKWANENLPKSTVYAVSGRDYGCHIYYRLPADIEVKNSAGVLAEEVDVRGEGGYIIVPPSSHPNGKKYEWRFIEGYRDWEELPELDPYTKKN